MNVEISKITSNSQFQQLAAEWPILLQKSRADSIFLTWEWIASWWQHFGEEYQLTIITARHPETQELLGIAPLKIHSRTWHKLVRVRECGFLEDGCAAPDHLDFILHPEFEDDIAPQMMDYIFNQLGWDILQLNSLAPDSIIRPLLAAHNAPDPLNEEEEICPFLPLPQTWEEMQTSLSRNFRTQNDRRTRKLQREFPNEIHIQQIKQISDLPQAMQQLYQLHDLIHTHPGSQSTFSSDSLRTFHLDIASKFLSQDWLRLYLLKVANKPVAALYCFTYNQIVSFYQSGYDPDWSKYGPGNQIMAHAIHQAIRENAQGFDFLRGDESYKFRWNALKHTDINLQIPGTRRGMNIMNLRTFWQRLHR